MRTFALLLALGLSAGTLLAQSLVLTPEAPGDRFGTGATVSAPAAPRPAAPPIEGLPVCAPGTLYGQPPDTPEDFLAQTSEFSRGLLRSENFQGVPGAISGLRWWGLDLRSLGNNTWQECAESDTTFDIIFYRDAGGVPGAVECAYQLTVTRTPLPDVYLGAQLNQYDVTLPAPCVLVNGWVSIVGRGDADCWFLWMSAGPGHSYCQGCVFPDESWDLSLCLIGEAGGVFGACCNEALQQCQDGVEINACAGPGQRFQPDTLCSELEPPCGVILGACCRPDATCDATTQAECQAQGGFWAGADVTCDRCPCTVPCPPGALAEGEPDCTTNYVDTYNGGCNSGASGFTPLTVGQQVCGRGGIFQATPDPRPDFDWYEFTLLQTRTIAWSVQPELPMQIWILNGSNGCPPTIISTTVGDTCEVISLTATLGPGVYWVVTAANQFNDESACGAEYVAALRATPLCPGDVDGDGRVTLDDLLLVLAGFGDSGLAPAGDLDLSGTVDLDDLLLVLASFGLDCT